MTRQTSAARLVIERKGTGLTNSLTLNFVAIESLQRQCDSPRSSLSTYFILRSNKQFETDSSQSEIDLPK